jgi:tetratricopeptide (TPR) repeat protein
MPDVDELVAKGYRDRRENRITDALRNYELAAALYREQDNPLRLAHTVRHVADILRGLGRWEEARALYAEAIEIYRAQPDSVALDMANALRGSALLKEATGADAVELWREARGLYAAAGIDAGVEEADRRIAAQGVSL